jgi:ABC-2 type transport system permease protein
MVAVIVIVVRSQTGQAAIAYWEYPSPLSLLVILFVAIVAPELVSRDIRGGVLPLYFSRPLTRVDYPLAKLAALMTATFLIIAGPQTLMFVGGAFTLKIGEVWDEFGRYSAGLTSAGLYAVVFSALALTVASLSGRRAVAAAMVVGLFIVTTPIYGVMLGLALEGGDDGSFEGSNMALAQLAGLVSPSTLVNGIGSWWFQILQPGQLDLVGPYGPAYLAVAAGLVVVSVLLLLLRYRKVAR